MNYTLIILPDSINLGQRTVPKSEQEPVEFCWLPDDSLTTELEVQISRSDELHYNYVKLNLTLLTLDDAQYQKVSESQ